MTSADPSAVSTHDEDLSAGPLVFISHDSRDAQIAEAFSKLLGSVTAGMLKTFRSSDKKGSQGFEYGVEWFPELMKTLSSACDVVCLLTKSSLERPWILYEAGVAKGKLDIPVHGLALGVSLAQVSTGPFAQFQNCDDDVDSITKLAIQLIHRLPRANPDREMVRSQVEVFREAIRQATMSDDDQARHQVDGEPSSSKLFEEIKVMFQDLPSRLERVVAISRPELRSRTRRVPIPIIAQIIDRAIREADASPGLVALIWASFLRDDLPWLYELSARACDPSVLNDKHLERRTLVSLVAIAKSVLRSQYVEDFGISPRYALGMCELLEAVTGVHRTDEQELPGDSTLLTSDEA